MSAHVDKWLARARDDTLTQGQAQRVREHLARCERCRRLAAELERIEPLFAVTRPNIDPRPSLELAPASRGPQVLLGLLTTVTVAAVALMIGLGLPSLRSNQGIGSSATQRASATTQASSPSGLDTKGAKLLVGEHTTTSGVPGGGAVFTGSFARFVLRDAGGAALLSHEAVGSAVGVPAFDGSHRLAYWSRADAGAVPSFQLRIWDLDRDADTAVGSPSARLAYGGPIWSLSGALIYASATPSTESARDVELHLVDAAGSDRTVARMPLGEQPLAPFWANADLVAGLAGHEYRVIAINNGQVVARLDLGASPPFELSTGQDVVVAIGRPFEAAPGPVIILRAADATRLTDVTVTNVSTALPRPGRSQIVLGIGAELRVFDDTTRATRLVATRADGLTPVVVSVDGRSTLIRSNAGYELMDLDAGSATPIVLPNAPTAVVLAVIDAR